MFRHAIERMDPIHYLSSSYYEHWLTALATSTCTSAIWRRHEGGPVSDDHGHHPTALTEIERRARALEELLTEKGIVDSAFIDAVVEAYAHDIGPMNGARVVARAWVDP